MMNDNAIKAVIRFYR